MRAASKFLKYVTFDTQSDPDSSSSPSTAKQLVLARELEQELKAIGVEDVQLDEYGIVYGHLSARGKEDAPAIGLVAHMDTAGEMSGKDVHPRIVKNYQGEPIELSEAYTMKLEDFPALEAVVGDDLIVTDGSTLLGADDKAGIAIIMQATEELIDSGKDHGEIFIAFTPDEEIGRGVENFDLSRFGADFAYTIDGGDVREINYETFNAAHATVRFEGRSIHPGTAKNKMINAAAAAVEFAALLPAWQRPEFTESREGFFHLVSMSGECIQAVLEYIIRDHDSEAFAHKKEVLEQSARLINTRYPGCCQVEIHDEYSNMKDYMNGDFRSVDLALKALKKEGIEAVPTPVRGGTDGAMLTRKGLVTPNLGSGGGNYHGRYEFASIQKMNKMVDVVRHILED